MEKQELYFAIKIEFLHIEASVCTGESGGFKSRGQHGRNSQRWEIMEDWLALIHGLSVEEATLSLLSISDVYSHLQIQQSPKLNGRLKIHAGN